jgi:hypothetical protein
MIVEDFGGVEVDICRNGCKGIWFDCGELAELDEKNEGAGKAIEDALESERTIDQDRGKLKCPKCGTPMQIHKYKHCKDVNIDECYVCGGVFLDSGELKAIKDGYMSDRQRNDYIGEKVKGYEAQLKTSEIHNQAINQLGELLSFKSTDSF